MILTESCVWHHVFLVCMINSLVEVSNLNYIWRQSVGLDLLLFGVGSPYRGCPAKLYSYSANLCIFHQLAYIEYITAYCNNLLADLLYLYNICFVWTVFLSPFHEFNRIIRRGNRLFNYVRYRHTIKVWSIKRPTQKNTSRTSAAIFYLHSWYFNFPLSFGYKRHFTLFPCQSRIEVRVLVTILI